MKKLLLALLILLPSTAAAQVQIWPSANVTAPTFADPSFTGQLRGPVGNCTTAPPYSFTGDLNNGWGSASADTQCWVTNAVERLTLSTTAFTSGVQIRGYSGSNSVPDFALGSASNTGFTTTSGFMQFVHLGNAVAALSSSFGSHGGFNLSDTGVFGWASSVPGQDADTRLTRAAAGIVGLNGSIRAGTGSTTNPTFAFSSETNSGWYYRGGGLVSLSLLGSEVHRFGATTYQFLSDTASIQFGSASDTILSRAAAGIIAANGAVRIGSNPAPATVGIGLTNNEGITYRQAGGAGNYLLIKGDGSNNILIGDTSSSDILPARTMRPSGSGATTSDLGNSTDPWRVGYFGSFSLGTTSTDGLVLANNTDAAAGAQQYSPRLRFSSEGWRTNATAESQVTDWVVENRPIQGAASPSSRLTWLSQVNAGGYTPRIAFDINATYPAIFDYGIKLKQLGASEADYVGLTWAANGQMDFLSGSGIGFRVNGMTDGTMKVLTRGGADTATISASRVQGDGTTLALSYDTNSRLNLTGAGLSFVSSGWQIASTVEGGWVANNLAGVNIDGTDGYLRIENKTIIANTAPTVSNGCTGEAMVVNNVGTAFFEADMGTSCTGVSTVVFTLPTMTQGWMCDAVNLTTAARNVEATAWSTTSVTFTNFVRTTGLAADWTDGDNVRVKCVAGG